MARDLAATSLFPSPLRGCALCLRMTAFSSVSHCLYIDVLAHIENRPDAETTTTKLHPTPLRLRVCITQSSVPEWENKRSNRKKPHIICFTTWLETTFICASVLKYLDWQTVFISPDCAEQSVINFSPRVMVVCWRLWEQLGLCHYS